MLQQLKRHARNFVGIRARSAIGLGPTNRSDDSSDCHRNPIYPKRSVPEADGSLLYSPPEQDLLDGLEQNVDVSEEGGILKIVQVHFELDQLLVFRGAVRA